MTRPIAPPPPCALKPHGWYTQPQRLAAPPPPSSPKRSPAITGGPGDVLRGALSPAHPHCRPLGHPEGAPPPPRDLSSFAFCGGRGGVFMSLQSAFNFRPLFHVSLFSRGTVF